MKEVTLPSGAKLCVTLAPFAASKALLQAFLEEGKSLELDPEADVDVNLIKDVVCLVFSSKKIELAFAECLKRVTYNDLKITADTFESVEAREDYLTVLIEVAKENLLPFTKSLSAEFGSLVSVLKSQQ